MKVIDLVNKIYNNEIRDNTKIKFINEPSATVWEYKTNFNTLSCGIMNKDLLMCLNDEIELIEEPEMTKEVEIPKKLDYKYKNTYGNMSVCKHSEIRIIDTLNDILDYLKAKEEGKEK